jgi:hypothetical protein
MELIDMIGPYAVREKAMASLRVYADGVAEP